MSQKILITYASRAGSTAEVALRMGAVLREQNLDLDILPVKQIHSLEPYRAVILGSAIRMGGWLPEAVKFVQDHQVILNELPCALFSVHLMNMGDDETSRSNRETYLNSVHAFIHPRLEACFAGVGNLNKLGLMERMIGKMVKAPEGDFRDWKSINNWALDTAREFSSVVRN
ncbi:MAG: flavodoxin domain-containing protein [Anaerolineae bacterium]|nr:flavodoxin domain-containing protein [Anaerolineae bacterium]